MKIHSEDELQAVKRFCEETATRTSWLTAAASGVPLLSMAVDAGLIANRIRYISTQFGLGPADFTAMKCEEAKIMSAVAAEIGNEFIGKFITRALIKAIVRRIGGRAASSALTRLIPIIGFVISGAISYTAARMILYTHINDCEAVVRHGLKYPHSREAIIQERRFKKGQPRLA